MTYQRLSCAVLFLCLGMTSAGQDPPPQADPGAHEDAAPRPAPLALVGGQVYSMQAAGADGLTSAPQRATVLVSEGRVEALGPDLQVPEGYRVLDASGRYVLPGLIDAAVHYDSDHDFLYLSSSVTLVRDTGNEVGRMLEERLPQARERGPGPDLLVAGPPLDGAAISSTHSLILPDGPQTRSRLEYLISTMDTKARDLRLTEGALRPDFLSFQGTLERPAWEALLQFAHEQLGLTVWGPLPRGVSLSEALGGGQDGLFGLDGLLPAERSWAAVQPEELRPGLESLAGSSTWVTPLLSASWRMQIDTGPGSDAARRLRWLSPSYEGLWNEESRGWQTLREQSGLDELVAKGLSAQLAALHSLWQAGVQLVPGSAASNPWIFPGAGLLGELEQWVAAGIPRTEVLRMATAGAAEALGQGAERGQLRPGMVADLVLCAGDPGQDLRFLADPEGLVLRGRWLDRAELQRGMLRVAERHAATRAALSEPLTIEAPEVPEGDLILSGYAEKSAFGMRVSAERFSVVRGYDGRTAYATRMLLQGGIERPDVELHLVQRFEGDRLVDFELQLQPRVADGLRIVARGAFLGESSSMVVRRTHERGVLETLTADDPVSMVDGSDVLTALILGSHMPAGEFYALSLEGAALEPGVDRWTMQPNAADGSLHVSSSRGRLATALAKDGTPLIFERQAGSGVTNSTVRESETFGGPGCPPAEGRVYHAPVPPGVTGDAAREDEPPAGGSGG